MIEITIKVEQAKLEALVNAPNGADTFEIYAVIVQLEKFKLQLLDMLPKGESFFARVEHEDEP